MQPRDHSHHRHAGRRKPLLLQATEGGCQLQSELYAAGARATSPPTDDPQPGSAASAELCSDTTVVAQGRRAAGSALGQPELLEQAVELVE